MDIHYSDNFEIPKVKIKGLIIDPDNIGSNLFDTGSAIAMIVGTMVGELATVLPVEKKRELADCIIDSAKEMIDGFYNHVSETESKMDEESKLYDFMCDCYMKVLEKYGIDEEEIMRLARTEKPNLFIEEKDEKYGFKLSLGNHTYTFGEIPVGRVYKESDKESFEATVAAIVLFDHAFPEDESKNPARKPGIFNTYYELLMNYIKDNQ